MASEDSDATVPGARSLRYFVSGQHQHAAAAVVLVAIARALAAPALDGSTWLGVADRAWFWSVLGVSVVHQAYVWVAWRAQLGWGVFTRAFGAYDLAVHAAVFGPLMLARVLCLAALALADPGSLALPRWVALALGVALLVPSSYTLYSVARYFGFVRALGADHFRTSFRAGGLVDDGAFAWSPNAMYTYGLLALWSVALLVGSHAALVAALFQHAFVWAHYAATERPDAALIYG